MTKTIRALANFILFLMSLIFLSCQSTAKEENNNTSTPTAKESMYGVWQILSFKVVYNATLEIPDSQYVFEVKEENWQQILSTKPTLSYFYPDNTFRQEFMDKNNVPYDTIRGVWNLLGDTLMLISPTATYTYHLQLASDRADYRSIIDWDGDGVEDDEYTAIYRQISRDPKQVVQ